MAERIAVLPQHALEFRIRASVVGEARQDGGEGPRDGAGPQSSREVKFGVGVGVLLRCDAKPGMVLLGRRLGSHGAGLYALPGGHLEYGESCEDVAVREVKEETNLDLDRSGIAIVHWDQSIDLEGGHHYVTAFCAAEVPALQVEQLENLEPDKCEGWDWVAWDNLPPAGELFVGLRNFLEAGVSPFGK
jgi:8-oxo-dGTP diphosphatase